MAASWRVEEPRDMRRHVGGLRLERDVGRHVGSSCVTSSPVASHLIPFISSLMRLCHDIVHVKDIQTKYTVNTFFKFNSIKK